MSTILLNGAGEPSRFDRDGDAHGRQPPNPSHRFTVCFEQPSSAAIRFTPQPSAFSFSIADTSSGAFITSLRGSQLRGKASFKLSIPQVPFSQGGNSSWRQGGSLTCRLTAVLHGLPEEIVMDNGPEFTSKALFLWSLKTSVQLRFIQPGKPMQNGYGESFNGKFRDE